MSQSAEEPQEEVDPQEIAAAVIFAGMTMMVSRGIPPAKALRNIAVELLQGTYGSAVWKELHVPSRTIERWRAELRQSLALAEEIEEEPPASVIDAFLRLQASKKEGRD